MGKKNIKPNQNQPVIRNNPEKPLGWSLLQGLASGEMDSAVSNGMNAAHCDTSACFISSAPHYHGDDE
ncbi:MAG: hypothetical protein F6K58_04150 [Symploca sp. SIO2E9]|nr:hypothetical protein [Symploca sp. SIO2E9]